MIEALPVHKSPLVLYLLGLLGLTLSFSIWQIFDSRIDPLADSWEMSPLVESIEWREGPGIPLRGDFNCASEVADDTPVQFQASVVFVADELHSSLSVPAFIGPKVEAAVICGQGPIEFDFPWSSLPEDANPPLPSEAFIRYSASAIGYQSTAIETDTFTVSPPAN